MKLQWDLPGPDEPGFLRRRRELLALLDAEATPENMDAVAQYLVRYVRGPIAHDEALVAIMELPLTEYAVLIGRLLSFNPAPVSPPLSGRSEGD